MLPFFDYLCYWFYLAYKRGGDSSPVFIAGSVVAVLQTFNICSGIMLYQGITMVDNPTLSKTFAIICYVSLVVLNYIRYIWIPKFSIESISRRWISESENAQKNSRQLQLLYVVLSSSVFLGIVLYYGIQKM